MGRRKRQRFKGSVDYKTGAVHIDFATAPDKTGAIRASYEADDGPPEPDVIDRLAAIDSPAAAARVKEFDDWVAAGRPMRVGKGFKLETFDFVSDPAVPNCYTP